MLSEPSSPKDKPNEGTKDTGAADVTRTGPGSIQGPASTGLDLLKCPDATKVASSHRQV